MNKNTIQKLIKLIESYDSKKIDIIDKYQDELTYLYLELDKGNDFQEYSYYANYFLRATQEDITKSNENWIDTVVSLLERMFEKIRENNHEEINNIKIKRENIQNLSKDKSDLNLSKTNEEFSINKDENNDDDTKEEKYYSETDTIIKSKTDTDLNELNYISLNETKEIEYKDKVDEDENNIIEHNQIELGIEDYSIKNSETFLCHNCNTVIELEEKKNFCPNCGYDFRVDEEIEEETYEELNNTILKKESELKYLDKEDLSLNKLVKIVQVLENKIDDLSKKVLILELNTPKEGFIDSGKMYKVFDDRIEIYKDNRLYRIINNIFVNIGRVHYGMEMLSMAIRYDNDYWIIGKNLNFSNNYAKHQYNNNPKKFDKLLKEYIKNI